jgi:hypothetical protein
MAVRLPGNRAARSVPATPSRARRGQPSAVPTAGSDCRSELTRHGRLATDVGCPSSKPRSGRLNPWSSGIMCAARGNSYGKWPQVYRRMRGTLGPRPFRAS